MFGLVKAFKQNFAFVFVNEYERVSPKENSRGFMCNGVWECGMKYISSLSTRDHKKKAHIKLQLGVFSYGSILIQIRKTFTQQELSYNFECLGMGLILVQIRKKITPQEHCSV